MPNMTIYTQSGCVTSQLWLEMLRDRGVHYTQKNIGSDPAAVDELRQLGSLATPTTVVDGQVLTGFNRARLAELTGSAAPASSANPASSVEPSRAPAQAAPE